MTWINRLEQIRDTTADLVRLTELYWQEIKRDYQAEVERGAATDKTLQVWKWQVDAADGLLRLADDELYDMVIRIMEQDYVLRRPDVNDILV